MNDAARTSSRLPWLLVAGLAILLVIMSVQYALLLGRVSVAAGHAGELSRVADDEQFGDRKAIEFLEGYYTSGSVQPAGSRLDELVEMVRTLAIEKVRRRAADRPDP